MRTKIFFALAALVCIGFGVQQYLDSLSSTPHNDRLIRHSQTGKLPNDWFFMQRAYPSGTINKTAHLKAVQQAKRLPSKSKVAAAWQPIGPTNIGGRITSLVVHPLDPNIIYIGAAAGGVFKSTDGGLQWTPIFDDQPSLSIGAIAINPINPETIYVGTGEANASGDSYPGDGIYKSTDGGQSWVNIGLEDSDHIGRITIHPANPDIIYVAACGRLFGKNQARGIYKSTDAGRTWQRSLFISDSTAAIDVAHNPQHPDTLYAAMWERIRSPSRRIVGGFTSGLYRTFDGGTNWTLLKNGLPPASKTNGRIGIAVAPSNPQTVYAIYADHPGYFAGIYKTSDHGERWQRVNDGNLGSLFFNFGWFFGNIKVDPTNADVAYALGVDFFKTTDGGNSWASIRRGIHVDQHAIDFDPQNPQSVMVGNDGGFYASSNGGLSWRKSRNLPITQFYAGTIDFLNPARSYGGTQDNGTLRTRTGSDDDWEMIYGGDGFYTIVDHSDSRYVYAELQYGGLGRSTDGGFTFTAATAGIAREDRRNWSTPVVIDPNNPAVLYYGANRLYRSANRAVSWIAISGDLTNGPGPGNLTFGTLTTIAVSPLDSNLIYAGTDDANVWVTPDGGKTWRNLSGGLPNRWVTRVTADPFDVGVAYVTFSGHASASYLPHIFRTTDRGETWTDISSNLPEAPINDVVIDPMNTATLYVATDVGVFYTMNPGARWNLLGTGMPFVPVHDLTLHPITRKLRAATHGRSCFEFDLNVLTRITSTESARPESFELRQNYPNPTTAHGENHATIIEFTLTERGEASLEVFDVLGRKIATLASGVLEPGRHRRKFDTAKLPSGAYVYRLSAAGRDGSRLTQSRTLAVVK